MIDLVHPEAEFAAVAALRPLADDEPIALDGTVRMMVRERSGVVMEAARLLDRAGVRADHLTVDRPSLDDVFLALTGRVTEPEEARAADGEPTNDTLEVAA